MWTSTPCGSCWRACCPPRRTAGQGGEPVDRLLENDLVVKIVSVLLAIALWFQVVVGQGASSRDVQRVIPGVAVSWRNLPPDLAVVSVDPKTVTVTVRGD